MKQYLNGDEPIFSATDVSSKGVDDKEKSKSPLTFDELTPEENRKNQILQFGFSTFYILLIAVGAVVVFDIIERAVGVQDSLLDEVFSLIKYATTTVLGFLFANNSK
jgi:hypothetical protein